MILHYLIKNYYQYNNEINDISKDTQHKQKLSVIEQQKLVENFKSIDYIINFFIKDKAMIKYIYEGIKPLLVAAERCDINWTEQLINMGMDVNVRDHSGKTPLIISCNNYCSDIMDIL